MRRVYSSKAFPNMDPEVLEFKAEGRQRVEGL